jgi:phosphatidylinositol kinase/protein kinase (PI-3  family)
VCLRRLSEDCLVWTQASDAGTPSTPHTLVFHHSDWIGSKVASCSLFHSLSVSLSLLSLCPHHYGPRSSSSKETVLEKAKKLMTKKMNAVAGQIPAHTWYACMPQIVSRIGHPFPDTVNIVKLILIKILGTFPHHGIWHFACLIHSLQQRRQEEAQSILSIASTTVELRSLFEDYKRFFDDLVNLARLQTNSKKVSYRIGDTLSHLGRFIVPMQAALTLCYPRHIEGMEASDRTEETVYFPTNQMHILNINNTVDVMNTKAKPKTIHINTTCGRTLRFLVKQEKSGDLRKDARMMEFNGVINRSCQQLTLFISLSSSVLPLPPP